MEINITRYQKFKLNLVKKNADASDIINFEKLNPIPTNGHSAHFSIGKDWVILNRIQIGHTWATHKHLMTNKEAQICETCNMPITINYVLTESRKYTDLGLKLHIPDHLPEALATEGREKNTHIPQTL